MLTSNESSPMLDEFFDLRLIHSEIPHHHSCVVPESQYHESLFGVTWLFEKENDKIIKRQFVVNARNNNQQLSQARRLGLVW